jgi:hypothetical protein
MNRVMQNLANSYPSALEAGLILLTAARYTHCTQQRGNVDNMTGTFFQNAR